MEITIGQLKYEIKKMTPSGIATVANVLGRLSVDGRKYMTSALGSKNQESFVWGILAVVTGEDLIKFTSALSGFSNEFVEQNFDLTWIMEVVNLQMKESGLNALFTNFTSGYSQTAE